LSRYTVGLFGRKDLFLHPCSRLENCSAAQHPANFEVLFQPKGPRAQTLRHTHTGSRTNKQIFLRGTEKKTVDHPICWHPPISNSEAVIASSLNQAIRSHPDLRSSHRVVLFSTFASDLQHSDVQVPKRCLILYFLWFGRPKPITGQSGF